jgi:hypothetical protein
MTQQSAADVMALYAGHLPMKLSNSSDVRYWPLADIPH